MKIYSHFLLFGMIPFVAFIQTCSVETKFLDGFHNVEHLDKIQTQKKRFTILQVESNQNASRESAIGNLILVIRDTNVKYWLINDTSGLYTYTSDPNNSSWVLLNTKTDKKTPIKKSEDNKYNFDLSKNLDFIVFGGTNIVNLSSMYKTIEGCSAVYIVGNSRTHEFYNTNSPYFADNFTYAVAAGEIGFIAEDNSLHSLTNRLKGL